jgi:FkbM family methyltransferase
VSVPTTVPAAAGGVADLPRRATRPPWQFRLGKALNRRGWRGGWWLVQLARAHGLLDRVVQYDVGAGVTVDVPLARPENCFDLRDVLTYEAQFIACLTSVVRDWPAPITFVDCGADIGLFASLFLRRCPHVERIVAFEPNAAAHACLVENVRRLGVRSEARQAAVSDFSGRGELHRPVYDPHSDYARFLVRTAQGPIVVERIDDVVPCRGANLVVKIDVEGGELSVLRGARLALAEATRVAIGFEAHVQVVRRTGTDPIEIVRAVQAMRPCRVVVSEAPDRDVRLDRPFFEQFHDRSVYNIVCVAE